MDAAEQSPPKDVDDIDDQQEPPPPEDDDDIDNQQEPPPPSPRETNSTRKLIIDQQNQAYEASLRADKEKAEKKEKERQEKLRKEEERKEKAKFLRSMKEEAQGNLFGEPVRTRGGGDDGIFTLQFRVPVSNISFRRNFRGSDTLQSLHQFVFSHPNTPYPFHIVRRPNQVIHLWNPDPHTTLHEAGFGVSEVLIIERGEALPPPPVEDAKLDEITTKNNS